MLEISKITKQYWTDADFLELEQCEDATVMYAIARRVIDRMPRPLVEVCGPIASGGLGNLEANLEAFNTTIKKLQSEGLHVFDQMPFEYPMQRLKKKIKDPMDILNQFYLPLFESEDIATFYFMKGWETSVGANWEHELVVRLGSEIKYL